MGCDIHLRVQGRRPDGTWEYVRTSPFLKYDEPGFTWADDPTSRNYMVFAFLADVRNADGAERIAPQFPARGLPDDGSASDDNSVEKADADLWRPAPKDFIAGDDDLGEHSFTYATLAELRAAPWDMTVTSGGMVNAVQFQVLRENGVPNEWCGGVGGPGITVWDNVEKFAALVDSGGARYHTYPNGARTSLDYCRVTWTWTPLTSCAFRRWVDGPTMSAFAEAYGGPENVRVLMGFDS